jgi:hypothetical protein
MKPLPRPAHFAHGADASAPSIQDGKAREALTEVRPIWGSTGESAYKRVGLVPWTSTAHIGVRS